MRGKSNILLTSFKLYDSYSHRQSGGSSSSDGDSVQTRNTTFLTNRDRKSIKSLRFK